MSTRILPSFDFINERLKVENGQLIWKIKRRGTVVAGSIAGRVHNGGYRQVSIGGYLYYAHRLVWLITHGRWPAEGLFIDHVNGLRDDNRPENLREVSHTENMRNLDPRGGKLGTYLHPGGSYEAKIRIDGKRLHLGSFPTQELAHAAYVAKRRELGWPELRSES